jgi:hypothetical protein
MGDGGDRCQNGVARGTRCRIVQRVGDSRRWPWRCQSSKPGREGAPTAALGSHGARHFTAARRIAVAGVRRVAPVTAHMTCRFSTGNHGGAPNLAETVKELALAMGNNSFATNRKHPTYIGLDVIDETWAQSFPPVSDAPGRAIGRGYRSAHRRRDVDQCSDPARKEEDSRVSNSQQDDSAPLFR